MIYRQHAHNRSIGWSTWHMQWCTKYRYKIFVSEILRNFCKILLEESAKRNGFEVLDLEVDSNHVHVIASLPLTMTPVLAIQYLKGSTSKGILNQFPFP